MQTDFPKTAKEIKFHLSQLKLESKTITNIIYPDRILPPSRMRSFIEGNKKYSSCLHYNIDDW